MNGQIVSKIVSKKKKKKSKKDLICSRCPTDSVLTAYVCEYVCARGWWVCVLLVLLLLGKIGCCFSAQIVGLGIGSFFGERVSLIVPFFAAG